MVIVCRRCWLSLCLMGGGCYTGCGSLLPGVCGVGVRCLSVLTVLSSLLFVCGVDVVSRRG